MYQKSLALGLTGNEMQSKNAVGLLSAYSEDQNMKRSKI